jgi:hypothetical protein
MMMRAVLFTAIFMGIYMAVRSSLLENPFHDTYPVFLMMFLHVITFPIIAFIAFLATALLVSAVQFAVSRDIFRSQRRRVGRVSSRVVGPDPHPDVDRSGEAEKV